MLNVFDLAARITLDSGDFELSLQGVTRQIKNFLGDSIETGMNFDKAMSQVAATLGYTTKQLNATDEELAAMSDKEREAAIEAQQNFATLREFAQKEGQSTVFTASQAAQALNYMALAGYKTKQSMQMLPAVLDLAASGNIELGYASDMVTDAQSALGLTAEDTFKMVDQMAKTASTTNTNVTQLGEAFLRIGGTARYMSGGTEEVAQVFGLLADNGIKGAEAGTHLRNMLLKLSSPTKDGAKALAKYGIEIYETSGEMRSMQSIFLDMQTALANLTDEQKVDFFSKVFNVRDIAAASALLNTTEKRWLEVSEAIDGAQASTEDFYANLEAALGTDKYEKLQTLMSDLGLSADQIETAWRTSGGTVGMFVTNLQTAAGDTKEITKAFENLDISLDGIQEAMTATQGAAGQMAKTQLDNLAGDMTLLGSAVEGAQIAISDTLSPTLRELSQFGSTAVSDLTKAFQEGGVEGAFSELGNVLQLGGQTIFNALSEIITGADWVSIGTKVFGIIIDGVADTIIKLPEQLNVIVENINKAMSEMDWIEVGKNLGSSISGALVSVVDEGGKFVSKIFGIDWADLGKNIISFIILGLGSTVITIGGKLAELANEAMTTLAGGEGEEVDWLSVGTQIVTNIGLGILQWSESFGNTVISFVNSAITKFASDEEIKKWIQAGTDLVNGIVTGIQNVAKDVVDGVLDLGSTALQAIKDFLHISSPSRVFRDEVGKMMALGLGIGFEDNMPIDDMVASAQDAVNAVAGVDGPTITPFGNSGGLADVLKNMNMNNQPVTINVYARADQNEKDVANEVQRQLIAWDRQRRAVWA